jgi:carboxyl-terminal processing protease
MKISLFAIPAFVVGTLCLVAFGPKPQPVQKDAAVLKTLMYALDMGHFDPKKIDDEFSIKVYDLYLDRIDAGRRFLTQEDVSMLDSYKSKVDDQIANSSFELLDLSSRLLDSGIVKAEGFYKSMIKETFDYTKNEKFLVDADKRPFPVNDAEMKDHWRKMLKYNILSKAADKIRDKQIAATTDGQKKTDPISTGKQSIDELYDTEADDKPLVALASIYAGYSKGTRDVLFEEARAEVEKEFDNWFKRLHKLQRSDRFSIYLNAITSVFDPHTEYFEPIEKANFDIGMSGRLEGIGARLQTTPDGEQTKITDIITGGPAWKGKELETDDIILKVQQETEPEAEDIAGFDINDVVKRIRGPKGTKVTLTVKKKIDGSVKNIIIIRDEVIIDEGYVKSLIIDDKENKQKVGYIRLPRFYADFEKSDGRQCARDVEKELVKLKAAGVDGIVFDLRNNGGGSLRDVVRMVGYFIESGPVVQIKNRDQDPEVLPDTDRRVQYDGPLVVMVNEFSASASEIMAAALQDYGRAVIVGSKTFGKGSVQKFIDLDRLSDEGEEFKPFGQVKISIQKFFRINGGSTQLEGVTPDILFPDNYSYVPVGEREAEHPMPFTRIDPESYSQSVFKISKLDKLNARTQKDLQASPTFRNIDANARRIKELRERMEVSLEMEAYLAEEERNQQLDKAYKDLLKPITSFSPSNLPGEIEEISKDESHKARNTEWLEDIQKDPYIFQTLRVLSGIN